MIFSQYFRVIVPHGIFEKKKFLTLVIVQLYLIVSTRPNFGLTDPHWACEHEMLPLQLM